MVIKHGNLRFKNNQISDYFKSKYLVMWYSYFWLFKIQIFVCDIFIFLVVRNPSIWLWNILFFGYEKSKYLVMISTIEKKICAHFTRGLVSRSCLFTAGPTGLVRASTFAASCTCSRLVHASTFAASCTCSCARYSSDCNSWAVCSWLSFSSCFCFQLKLNGYFIFCLFPCI